MNSLKDIRSSRSAEEWRPFMERLMTDFRREKRSRVWVRGGLAALAGAAAAAWILLTWSPHTSLPHAVVPTTEASLFVPRNGVVMIVRQNPGQGEIPQEKSS